MEKVTRKTINGRLIFAFIMVFVLAMGMVSMGALEINASDAGVKTQIENYKAEAISEIKALKNDNSLVVTALNKYIARVEYAANTDNIPSDSSLDYANKVHLELNEIVSDAHKEVDFLKKKLDVLNKLQNEYKALSASGKYTGEARTKLDETYKAIANDIGKIKLADGIAKLDSVYAGAKTRFDKVEIFVSTLTANGGNGSMEGRVHSTLGFPKSKNLIIIKQALKAPSGFMPKNDVDKLSADAVKAAVTDKENLFTFQLRVEGYNDVNVQNNGAVYTVRITLDDQYTKSDGYSVISYDASGNEYIHDAIKYGKYVEFKTSMLSNDFTLICDVTKDMTWLIVLLAVLAIGEIIATVAFTVKKNKLASVAVIPFMAVMYAPGSFAIIAGILGAVALTGAALTVLSGVVYAKAKKAKNAPAEEKPEAKAESKPEPKQEEAKPEVKEEPKTSEKAAEEAEEVIEAKEEATSEQKDYEEEKVKKSAPVFIPLTSDEEEKETADADGPEDGAYDADDERYNEAENEEEASYDDDAAYEADTVGTTYVVEKNDGDGAYEDDGRERSYSGNDGEYEADGKTVSPRRAAKDADAEYGLADDHVFSSDRGSKKKNDGLPIIVFPVTKNNADEDDQDDDNDKDIVVLPEDGNEELTNEMRVFSAEDGEKVYVTYDYSFDSKLRLSAEETRYRYQVISDTLLSYGLKVRQSWKQERYYAKGKNYVKLIFRGKTPCICFAIEPDSLKGTKYAVEDVSSIKKYEDVPSMMRVRSGRGCKYAIELIQMMMVSAGIMQQRDVKDEFDAISSMTKEELVKNGSIKVMMTDGHGDIVAADFEAMRNSKFNLVNGGIALHKHVSVEEVAEISDETVAAFIEIEADPDPENNDEVTYGSKKGIINIDTISAAYNDGDVVTIDNLIEKGLVQKNIHFIKVLARGELDKALTVKAHDFSMDAAKMIVVAGGNVIELKSKKVKD